MGDTDFEDSMGRRWLVPAPIDWQTIHRVRSIASVDLHSLSKRGVQPLPAADAARTRLALYALVKPFADHAGITREDFCQSICDPAVESAAVAAVLEALAYAEPSEGQPAEPIKSRSAFRDPQ